MKIADPQVVREYLEKELEEGRIVQISPAEAETMNVHCSPMGIIPKRNHPGKWRLRVNDGIDKKLCSLSYTLVDAIARKIVEMGQGMSLAKMDIR